MRKRLYEVERRLFAVCIPTSRPAVYPNRSSFCEYCNHDQLYLTGDFCNFIDSFIPAWEACFTHVDIQEAYGSTRQQLKINTVPSRGTLNQALSWENCGVMIQLFLAMGLELIRINALLQIITASISVNEKQLLKHHKHLLHNWPGEPTPGPCKLRNSLSFQFVGYCRNRI